MEDLHNVEATTLLIVGSLDFDVFELNREAFENLECEKKLGVVHGATHIFEEQGMMEIVSELVAA